MATVRTTQFIKPSEGVRYVTAVVDQIGTSGSVSSIYTGPSQHIGLMKTATISNANAAAREFTLQVVRNSATGTPTDIILEAGSIDGNSILSFFDIGHVNPTDEVQAFASSATSVDVTIFIEEYQYQAGL